MGSSAFVPLPLYLQLVLPCFPSLTSIPRIFSPMDALNVCSASALPCFAACYLHSRC